jgi:hypothetical protein
LNVPEVYLNKYSFMSCDSSGPKDVPAKLSYLKSLNGNGMGLVFWGMESGIALQGNNSNKPDLSKPTFYSGSAMTCDYPAQPGVPPPNQLVNIYGYGQDVIDWFKINSVRF